MSYDKQQRNEILKSASTTAFRLDVKRIGSNQHGSSKMRAPVPPANRTTKFPKLKTRNHVNQSSSGFRHEANKNSEHNTELPPTVYGNGKYADEGVPRRDELVRYMSNLPDYLLRPEKGEKFQEKVLNVGVLDWGRLETWKYKQNGTRARGGNNASCSGGDNLLVRKPCQSSTAAVNKKKPYETFVSLTSKEKVFHRYDHSQYDRKFHESARSAQDFQDEILLATEGQRWIPCTYKSLDKNRADISLTKGKRADQVKKITSRLGTSASSSHYGITVNPQEHENDYQGEDEGTETCLKREGRHCYSGDVGVLLSKSDSSAPSLCSSKSIHKSNGGSVKMVESVQDTNIDVDSEECPRKGSNIVLLVPKKKNQARLPQNSHEAETRTVADDNVRKPRKISFPDGFAEKTQFAKCNSEISYPTALHPGGKPNKLSSVVPRSQDQDTDFSSVVSRSSSCSDKASSLLSETTYEDCDESDMKPVSQPTDTILRGPLDEGTAEMTSKRSRHSSPTRRFSFSLSRIGRSFSFKEGSSLPRFSSGHSSVKSGPVTVESSTSLDNSNKDKLIAHNRSRSSPFRRLLDPLRKHKVADSLHSAETPQGLKKGSIDAMSSMINNVGESLNLGKNDGSTVRAVLHHTVKNGVPLYKFKVNNESSILVTTVKNLPSYEKDSKACNFTFYAVDEIKKKSGGWIGLGGKEKSCGYVYNVVGQMKDCGSHLSELNGNISLKQCTKEYVLLEVETKQDPGSPKVNHSKELAAAVIRIPYENFTCGELPHDMNFTEQGCNKFLAKEHCPCSSGEDEIFSSATVILPGGVHGSPNNGAPSPLIFRWKSGGSCDCGGWDIGCKLHVLHSQKQSFSVSECRAPCALSGHLELYLEGRGEQTRLIFSMAPLKNGMRSVEFRSPITVLQAFFICVAVESSQKSSSFSELYSLHDLFAKEPSSKENDFFHFQGNAPAKYTPNPPLSPVGRV